MIIESAFKPIWWLTNGHAQTIYPSLTKHTQVAIDQHERVELPDGDFLDLSWVVNGLDQASPLVLLLHGLGGSINSVYVSGLLRAFNQCGYRSVFLHFRGASHEPNRLPQVYHSGATADLHYIMEWLKAREPDTKKAAVGISLGGNVLLKWLGERGVQSFIQSAVAVSVPFQLQLAANKMQQGFSRLYQAYLLRRLHNLVLKKLDIINTHLPMSKRQLFSLKTLFDFDEHITAPLHGFANADDYYKTCSSRQYLKDIATPTLIIHALDDPFMTPMAIPHENELADPVVLELSQKGGHVGFISKNIKNPHSPAYWLEQRIPDFLMRYLL